MNFEFCMSLASLKVRLEALGNLGISLVALRAVRIQSQIDSIEKVLAQAQVQWIRDSLASECNRLKEELQLATQDLFDLLEKDKAQFEHDQNVWAFWKEHSEALRLVDAFSSELDPAWFQPIVVHLEQRYAQLVADQTHLDPEPKHAHKHSKQETRESDKLKAHRTVLLDERQSKPRRFDRQRIRYSKRSDAAPQKENRQHSLPAPSDARRRQDESFHSSSRAKSATRPAPAQEKTPRGATSRYDYDADLLDSIEDSFASDPYAKSEVEREKLSARLGLGKSGKRVVDEADTYVVLRNLYPEDEETRDEDEEMREEDEEMREEDDEGSQQDDKDTGEEEDQDVRRYPVARSMEGQSQDGSMPELEEGDAPASPRSVVSLEGALTRDQQKAIVLKGKADALLSSQASRSGFR
jgi:hypothetical protein